MRIFSFFPNTLLECHFLKSFRHIYIVIQGVAKDSKYKVTENAEDYKSTPADAIDNAEGRGDATSGTVASKDIYTGYLNTRDGVIPTGVIMTVAPFAAVTLLGGAGAVTMVMKKKKSEEE